MTGAKNSVTTKKFVQDCHVCNRTEYARAICSYHEIQPKTIISFEFANVIEECWTDQAVSYMESLEHDFHQSKNILTVLQIQLSCVVERFEVDVLANPSILGISKSLKQVLFFSEDVLHRKMKVFMDRLG